MSNVPFATNQRVQTSVDGLVGRVFNNRFRIQSLIARGGMGKVYRALQLPLGRTVALKVLNPAFTAEQSADFHRRFVLEAAVVARLNHAHTVTVYDFGRTDDDIYYIAMEYLEGTPLRSALTRAQVFPPRRALHVATQISEALREAHALGAVHRDLKPANVLLLHRGNERDFVKVLDFGLVKHVAMPDDHITQPGKFLGSPGYMAPEQIQGHPLDTRCDIYALGVLLFEMLTGRPPYVRANHLETMRAHVHDPVPRLRDALPSLRVPQPLEELVARCLAKEPAARYPTMDAVLETLAALTGSTPAPMVNAVSMVRPTPVRLEDEEASGWAVVSSTGILAIPHALRRPPVDEVPTLAMDGTDATQILALASPPPPAPPLAPPEHAAGVQHPQRWAAVMLGVLALTLMTCLWAGRPSAPTQGWEGVTLKLTTRPTGAAAYLGDVLLCEHTPCQVRWESDQAAPGNAVQLRFVLDGFDEYIASRVIASPELRVHGALTR